MYEMYSIINEGQQHVTNLNTIETSPDEHQESGRGCRSKKKQMDPACCPVCSVTLRVSELNSHLGMEMEKLSKLSHHKQKPCTKITSPSSGGPSASTENNTNGWETYQKVRANRQGRLKIKSKKRKTDEMTCPVCNKVTSEDLTIHVEMCLQRMDTSEANSDDESIDVEGDNGKFEEYEWAGQTRVRASSLLEGGFTGLGIGTSISKSTAADEDADVIVDGDDTQIYGPSHYTDQDVLNSMEEHADINSEECSKTKDDNNDIDAEQESAKDVIIESLKLKIRELEDRNQLKEQYKCLICMGRYKNPVVSICCWHVHCEKCWLQTLAAKKICPQCNMITSAAELRRIFI